MRDYGRGRDRLPWPVVEISSSPQKRATGWLVECEHPAHGKMPVLAPSRDAAVIAAGRHLETEHRREGRIVLVEKRPKSKKNRRRRKAA